MLKKLINNYAFEKTKHLELSDTFLEHSQIFSDSFQILKALGQAISIVVFAIGFPIFAIIASYKKWWGLQSIAVQYTQLEQKRW